MRWIVLKVSGLPASNLAQKTCEAGLVLVNGKVAKPAATVKAGDELSLRRGERITKVRILALPAARQTSRSDATSLYEMIDEIRVAAEDGIDTRSIAVD